MIQPGADRHRAGLARTIESGWWAGRRHGIDIRVSEHAARSARFRRWRRRPGGLPPLRDERPLHAEAIDHSRLDACPWCLTTDLYTQKDFPQALGLMIVIVQFAISTVFWYYEMPIATYSVLLASALLDWALYPRVPDVTICYRCSCQVRGEGSNPEGRFQPFDLAIGERYRQERIRAQQLRERGASADWIDGARERDARVGVRLARAGRQQAQPGLMGLCIFSIRADES